MLLDFLLCLLPVELFTRSCIHDRDLHPRRTCLDATQVLDGEVLIDSNALSKVSERYFANTDEIVYLLASGTGLRSSRHSTDRGVVVEEGDVERLRLEIPPRCLIEGHGVAVLAAEDRTHAS